MLTAILKEIHSLSVPTDAVREIRELADLSEPFEADQCEGPLTAQTELIDAGNWESLAVLDRRFRWLSPRRKSAEQSRS